MIIDGKRLSKQILNNLKKKNTEVDPKPGLAAILVGSDKASHTYVRLKEKASQEVGIYFEKHLLPSSVSQREILDLIDSLNKSEKIDAILVQLPLPKRFNTQKIIERVADQKDVDGFKPGSLVKTPVLIAAILGLIKSTKVNLENKKASILANSDIFAEPLSQALKTFCLKVGILLKPNNRTIGQLNNSDVVIIALGSPKFLKAEMIKKNSIIIDVGINKINNQIVGDVDFESVSKKAGFITPVPGGVGPMTVACLMKNTYELYKMHNSQ